LRIVEFWLFAGGMNWYQRNDLRVLIDDLIAFTWSAPMRDLAAKIGISDVGLKKLLRGYGVASPPQGHWNRVHAGKRVQERPKALPRGPGETGRIYLDNRFRGHIEPAPAFPVDGPFASARVPEDLAELRDREHKAIGKAAAPRSLAGENLSGIRDILAAEEKRREKAAATDWHYDKPKFASPFYQRQLRLLCGLFRALERRGHSGHAQDLNGRIHAQVTIGDTSLGLSIEVIGKHATEMLAGCRRPAVGLPAATPLRFELDGKLRRELPRHWEDCANAPLEDQLANIAADLIVAGEATFRQSLVIEQEYLAEQRRREEEARRKRLAELEARRLDQLRRSGELLREAENIRALVASVKAAVLTGKKQISADELAQWEEWALDYANRVDPVTSGQVLSHIRPPILD
jgi:hypothetical protein